MSDEQTLSMWRKKPVVIEATQWFKNGDHPADYAGGTEGFENGEWRTWTEEEFRALGWEGTVVRYFRLPDVSGEKPCDHCQVRMHEHGWIDTLEGGHIVCPGDWIITGVKGERYPCKPDIFAATYEPANTHTLTPLPDREAVARMVEELRKAADNSSRVDRLMAEGKSLRNSDGEHKDLYAWSEPAQTLYGRAADFILALAAPAVQSDGELQSYEKFDGVGPHHETIETRARIGERYLECYESALSHPAIKGYTPADCPTELLLDLVDWIATSPQPTSAAYQLPEGMVLVPREPTEAMVEDGDEAGSIINYVGCNSAAAWNAMLAAAPPGAAAPVAGEVTRITPEDAWRDLVEMDDRTSPADDPDHVFITFDELRSYMTAAAGCTCCEVYGENPECILHGINTVWGRENATSEELAAHSTLQTRHAAAIEALRPFADACDNAESEDPEEWAKTRLLVRHFRAARAIVQQSGAREA